MRERAREIGGSLRIEAAPDAEPAELLAAIRTVARGGSYLSGRHALTGRNARSQRLSWELYGYTVCASQPQDFSMPHLYRQGYKPSRLQMPKWMRKAWAWL